MEDWRYTNVSALAKQKLELASSSAAAPALGYSACFVDGRLVENDGSVVGLGSTACRALGTLAELKGHPFAALNTAFLDEGAWVRVRKGENPRAPIHLLFVSTGSLPRQIVHPRVVLEAEAGSEAIVIEEHLAIGAGAVLDNSVIEILVGENASLQHVLVQRASATGHLVSNTRARVEKNGRLSSHVVTLSGHLVRNDLRVSLAGEGAECDLRGLFLGRGECVVDNHTWVDHDLPHCTSRELYKGILGEKSRGVFRGRVVVRPDAQKSDAQQSNPNLLLGRGAEIDTKPQLEIYADDVKCSHGSTVGQLDPDALFYLRARGIDEADALEILTQGFAAEITEALPSEALVERITALVLDHIPGAGEAR